MAEVPDTVDDAITALPGSPSTEDVFEGTIEFSARELAASAARRALGGGGGGSQTVLSASLHLSSAQILTLDTVPVQIVAAPGAGKALVPISGVAKWNPVTTPYTAGDSTRISITYASAQITELLTTGVMGTFYNPADVGLFTDTVTRYVPFHLIVLGSFDGVGAVVQNDAAVVRLGIPIVGGDGTLDLRITYTIADFT